MANPYFQFKQFTVYHDRSAMKVTTDSCFFGAWVAKQIKKELKIKNVLDIGTGTGLLSLMIAQKNNIDIDAVEIDRDAAQQAIENISSSPWSGRIKIFNQNILDFHSLHKYDCVICNPPFYENELNSAEQKKNIAHHSSEVTIKQILHEIKKNLNSDRIFFLMYPSKRENEIDDLLNENNFYTTKKVILKQSLNHSAFRIIIMATNKQIDQTEISEIAIWSENSRYTEEFIDLLKEYYLYL